MTGMTSMIKMNSVTINEMTWMTGMTRMSWMTGMTSMIKMNRMTINEMTWTAGMTGMTVMTRRDNQD